VYFTLGSFPISELIGFGDTAYRGIGTPFQSPAQNTPPAVSSKRRWADTKTEIESRKKEYSIMRDKYKGMTVNERLYASDLLEKYDDAVKKKDVENIISILEEVELFEKSIIPILENLGLLGEKHEYKREKFIDNTLKYFKFLETEFEYSKPNHSFHKQENGTVITDKIEYKNISLNKKIVISNNYHPNDYGFEINIIDEESGRKEMLFYVLKEEQDIKQEYLKEQGEALKNYCKQIDWSK
jgi:hypothetical protein